MIYIVIAYWLLIIFAGAYIRSSTTEVDRYIVYDTKKGDLE